MASTAWRYGPKDPVGDARWQVATGRLTAARTGQAMEPILVDDRFDPGQFSDLMDQRFRVVAGEPMAASAASGWLTMDRLMNLFGGDQRTVGFAMPRLSTPFLSAGRSWGLALHSDRIRGRGLRRVGGVEIEPVLEIVDARFKFGKALFVELDERKNRRLDFWRSRLPQGFWDRGRPCHTGRIIASFANHNPRL